MTIWSVIMKKWSIQRKKNSMVIRSISATSRKRSIQRRRMRRGTITNSIVVWSIKSTSRKRSIQRKRLRTETINDRLLIWSINITSEKTSMQWTRTTMETINQNGHLIDQNHQQKMIHPTKESKNRNEQQFDGDSIYQTDQGWWSTQWLSFVFFHLNAMLKERVKRYDLNR